MRKTPRSSSGDSCVTVGRRYWLGLAALVSALQPLGCGAACDTSDEGNPPVLFRDGDTNGGVYETSAWGALLLPFPGGKQYLLEHHLGFAPASVEVYFGFDAADSVLAPCAGNSCLILCVDDEVVRIKNDTCAEFFVRVVASGLSGTHRLRTCGEEDEADAGETSTDAGATPDGTLDGASGDP